MNSKEREINKLINQKQQSLEAEKNKKEEYNQSLVELYKRLKKDINELIYLSFEDIKDLISKFEVDDYDKLVNDITTNLLCNDITIILHYLKKIKIIIIIF